MLVAYRAALRKQTANSAVHAYISLTTTKSRWTFGDIEIAVDLSLTADRRVQSAHLVFDMARACFMLFPGHRFFSLNSKPHSLHLFTITHYHYTHSNK